MKHETWKFVVIKHLFPSPSPSPLSCSLKNVTQKIFRTNKTIERYRQTCQLVNSILFRSFPTNDLKIVTEIVGNAGRDEKIFALHSMLVGFVVALLVSPVL